MAEGRMRGSGDMKLLHFPLTLTLSLMERGRKTFLAANQNESQSRLKIILWKPLHKQEIGWEPDERQGS